MIKLKTTGIDKVIKNLEYLKSDEFMKESITNIIVKKVPEAKAESRNFRFKKTARGSFELDPNSVNAVLYYKIAKAFR